MKNKNVKIHHLYHSGFTVETPNHFLIFDYYLDEVAEGKSRSIENGIITADYLQDKDKVIVFVTHNHGDHFNPVIFHWQEVNPNITYILGDDCIVPSNIQRVFVMRSEDSHVLEDNTLIKAYGTTDRGVSFYVEVDGLNIYHAGDLNWWYWKSFSQEALLKEEEDFKTEVNKITEAIDIAFVPVDPRLEEYFHIGGEYFAYTLNPQLLIPMHFADQYKITEDFSNKMLAHPVPTAIIKERGQLIHFSKSY